MKSDRYQGNALTGASIKMTNTRYNKCKNPDKSELLTKDLKVAKKTGVIFSELPDITSHDVILPPITVETDSVIM